MFKLLAPGDGIGGTGFDAQTAEGTHRQVINVFVDDAFLLAVGHVDPGLDDLDGTVRAGCFTNTATGAAMFVVLVVRHDHFAFEPVVHFQGLPVFRVLLGYDFPGAEEVSPGYFHPRQERFHSMEDISEVFEKAAHSFLKMPTH